MTGKELQEQVKNVDRRVDETNRSLWNLQKFNNNLINFILQLCQNNKDTDFYEENQEIIKLFIEEYIPRDYVYFDWYLSRCEKATEKDIQNEYEYIDSLYKNGYFEGNWDFNDEHRFDNISLLYVYKDWTAISFMSGVEEWIFNEFIDNLPSFIENHSVTYDSIDDYLNDFLSNLMIINFEDGYYYQLEYNIHDGAETTSEIYNQEIYPHDMGTFDSNNTTFYSGERCFLLINPIEL